MAPRRNNSAHSGVDVHNLLSGLSDPDHNFDSTTIGGSGGGGGGCGVIGVNGCGLMGGNAGGNNSHSNGNHQEGGNNIINCGGVNGSSNPLTLQENFTRCCVPNGDCFKSNAPDFGLINLDDLSDCIRVICNNENCTAGQYMHRECFESWEQGVLTFLKSIGRARSWSDRQRAQNLWTKKGYDLVFKACGCKCGRGHLKKDLDWIPPTNNNISGRFDEEGSKKKKKRNRNNQKPTLAISANPGGYHPNSQMNNTNNNNNSNNISSNNHHHANNGGNNHNGGNVNVNCNNPNNGNNHTNGINSNNILHELRGRAGSLSSGSNGSSSPPASAGSSDHSISPVHSANLIIGKKPQISPPPPLLQSSMQQQYHLQQQQQHVLLLQQQQTAFQQQQQQQKAKIELYSERVRSTSGCNGIFSRRLDFSSFNLLPKTRLNSYQVKMEDEGNHGNDETRLFILSSLAQHQKNRVSCVLCEEPMLVFDRYPLVDGSFFLSPKQHAPGCIEVKYEERIHYLTAVCMVCLDGNTSNHAIYCRFCGERWDGSSLVLGTMYSYDIFAAMPCCVERLQCNACLKLLLHPQQMLNFYSNYSQMVSCPYCTIQDYHFVKPLGYCYTKQSVKINLQ